MFDFKQFKDTELHDEALSILDLVEQYRQREISRDELNELLQDLHRTELIEAQANDLQLKANLMRAVEIILKML